ncbi:MAG: RpiB/LacA/LacB family sugar-phosphate isomerase [bacterium]|nr:RpiB/LacA/LacB family sugar-phosphate isomerase [bacterium]
MLYIAADHRGFELKDDIKTFLQEKGVAFEDLGNNVYAPEDNYPDFGRLVAGKISQDPDKNRGILICGSGIGMAIIANRYKGVRAGSCLSPWMAEHGRQSDNINVLGLASDLTDLITAKKIVETFLNTEFTKEEKYHKRVEGIDRS